MDENPYQSPAETGPPVVRIGFWQRIENAIPEGVPERVAIGIVMGVVLFPLLLSFLLLLLRFVVPPFDD
jgi:hypothetical protein